jgi:hypothetical protein
MNRDVEISDVAIHRASEWIESDGAVGPLSALEVAKVIAKIFIENIKSGRANMTLSGDKK